jgi:hypothetical protein
MADQPNITGPWQSDDNSQHRLELAITDQVVQSGASGPQGKSQHVLAMRNAAEPGQILYVTERQLHTFMSSAQQKDSAVARVLTGSTASAGGGSPR